MFFFRETELKARQLLEGITLRAVSGDKTMMTFFEFEPHALIPHHTHAHEQITYVIEGEIEFTVDGETKLLKAGDGVIILSNQEHSARILDRPAKALDAWYPIREDYRCTQKESRD
jgi:quercetin dioxygenase-like cupin family protein